MKTGPITLLGLLLTSTCVLAQAPDPPKEFTLRALTLALRNPINVANRDGTPMTTGHVLWVAVKNETAIPYSLCTAAKGMTTLFGSGVGAASHCSPYWIVLPGETHFEPFGSSVPVDPAASLRLDVWLEGKPLGSTENLRRWLLKWQGTGWEALAAGEAMKPSDLP
jgi:hypothetical protein